MRQARTSVLLQAARELTVAVPSAPTPASLTVAQERTCALPIITASAALIGAAWWFKVKAEKGKGSWRRQIREPLPELALSKETDPAQWQMALHRTRQCQHVSKAVSLMKAGEPTRALVELKRALAENEICRTPLLSGAYSHEELTDLYKLHLKFGEMPPSFPLLLQLREMMSLSGAEAERIETEVLQEGCCFSI